MSSSVISLSVIVPVYNEVGNIDVLCQEIVHALSTLGSSYEIIFVDDGSMDGTHECLKKLTLYYPHVNIVTHKTNYGQSAALVSGARYAQYAWLVSLDGDGQNDPRDIPALITALQQHQDKVIVVGTRKKRHDNFLRKLSSKIGNGVRKNLLRDDCPDTGCSLKLFPKTTFLELPHFNHLHRFLPSLFKRAGYKTINIPVNHRPRLHGISKYGVMNRLWVGIFDICGVLWLLRRPCNPELKNDN